MRIALVNPTYWPEVRRGAERLVHDLAASLAAAGHEVTVLTSHRARGRTSLEDGFRVVRSYRLPDRIFHARSYNYHLHVGPALMWQLAKGDYDVAHAFQPAAAWAAVEATRFGGPPVVFSILGALTKEWVVSDRLRWRMVERTLRGAAATTVLSEAVAADFRRFTGRDPLVLPGGVRSKDFKVEAPRAPVATLVCAASLNDPRKRGGLLLRAFTRLRRKRPELRLLLAGRPDPIIVHGRSLELPSGAQWIQGDDSDDLARAYAASWASVLPAVDEAFGLVLLESLAAGTPAVAAHSGGCPEILDSAGIGALFRPDDEDDLVRALESALALGAQPGTAEACRARARSFDWSVIAPAYQEVYRRSVARI